MTQGTMPRTSRAGQRGRRPNPAPQRGLEGAGGQRGGERRGGAWLSSSQWPALLPPGEEMPAASVSLATLVPSAHRARHGAYPLASMTAWNSLPLFQQHLSHVVA